MGRNNSNYPDDIRQYDDDPRSPFYDDEKPVKDQDYYEQKADHDYDIRKDEESENAKT